MNRVECLYRDKAFARAKRTFEGNVYTRNISNNVTRISSRRFALGVLTTKGACDEEEKGNGGKERNYSGLIMRESCLLVFACGLCSLRARLGCNEERKRKEVNLLENRRIDARRKRLITRPFAARWIFGSSVSPSKGLNR